ncbi:hypothetical protein NOC27_873 [Nitrosococcus oceani AFC27]|nr:hypothetical protein NOC27_873 [Nitrosococcus oceani AFC27]
MLVVLWDEVEVSPYPRQGNKNRNIIKAKTSATSCIKGSSLVEP